MKRATLLALLITLAGCGGGGGGDGPVMDGVLTLGAPVAGLGYATPTLSGVTDGSGAFQYRSGESVRFFIGSIDVGSLSAGEPAVTVVDIVPGAWFPVSPREVKRFLGPTSGQAPTPESRLINLLAFLYSCDEDKDGSNGISLHPALATAIRTRPSSHAFPWQVEETQRRARYEAYAAGCTANARAVGWGEALDLAAAALGLAPQVYAGVRFADDRDGDGVVDSIQTYGLTPQGLPQSLESDDDGDGQLDARRRAAFDASLDRTDLWLGTGATEQRYRLTYDIHGRLATRTWDYTDDGTPEEHETYRYDAYGNLIRLEERSTAGGPLTAVTNGTVDGEGRLVRVELDHGVNGILDRITTYAYDAAGNRILEARDFDADGTPERTYTFAYDALGRLMEQTFRSTDGSGAWHREYAYDAAGRRALERSDSDGDGTWDSITAWTYREDNQLSAQRVDTNANGIFDAVVTYQYDAQGRIVGLVQESGDPLVISVWVLEYDANGDLIRYTIDTDDDGMIDAEHLFQYDAFGNELFRADDYDGDGSVDATLSQAHAQVTFRTLQLLNTAFNP